VQAQATMPFARPRLRVKGRTLPAIGGALLIVIVLCCFIGPLLYRTNQTDAQKALLESFQNAPPGAHHLLGTDQAGFDILGRLMVGGRTSLEIAFAAAFLATTAGTIWGAVSGLAVGPVDSLMMRIVDIVISIPLLFLVIVLAVVFRPTTPVLILVIAGVSWAGTARLVRAETLSLRERGFVEAARSMGAGGRHTIVHHIFPNTLGTVIVNAVFQVADAILLLAALGFIGLGVSSPQTDWGSMLSDGVNYALDGYWWETYPAGIVIVLVIVALNLLGEGLQAGLRPPANT